MLGVWELWCAAVGAGSTLGGSLERRDWIVCPLLEKNGTLLLLLCLFLCLLADCMSVSRTKGSCDRVLLPSPSLVVTFPILDCTTSLCTTPLLRRRSLWTPHSEHRFRHLPPNSARFSYATEGVLFISAQLSSDAVSALRKVWVLI